MEFKIKEETLQNILNYLATRPYSEVTKLINEIQTVEKIEEVKEVAKKEVAKK